MSASAQLAAHHRHAGIAFPVHASLTVSFLAGSSLPTPLYPLYQAAWGFTPITVTVVFGLYALAVLAALLVAGRLADHLGRKPVLLAAIAAQIVAMALFATAHGVGALLLARLIQGLAAGTALGAIGAALLDLHRERGTIANAIAPIMGTALGALTSGIMVHYLPAPLQLSYACMAVVLLLQGAAIAWLPESVTARSGAWRSLRPHARVPPAAAPAMLAAAPVLIAIWAIAGLYASLGPALVKRVFGADPSLYGGMALFILSTSGALAVLALRRAGSATLLRAGAASVGAGAALLLLSLWTGQGVLYCLATILTGMGFGAGFQGAIRTIVAPVAPHERAAVLSVVYVVSYLSMGLPAVLAGCAVVAGCGLLDTAYAFGAVVMLLAGLALAASRRIPSGALA